MQNRLKYLWTIHPCLFFFFLLFAFLLHSISVTHSLLSLCKALASVLHTCDLFVAVFSTREVLFRGLPAQLCREGAGENKKWWLKEKKQNSRRRSVGEVWVVIGNRKKGKVYVLEQRRCSHQRKRQRSAKKRTWHWKRKWTTCRRRRCYFFFFWLRQATDRISSDSDEASYCLLDNVHLW